MRKISLRLALLPAHPYWANFLKHCLCIALTEDTAQCNLTGRVTSIMVHIGALSRRKSGGATACAWVALLIAFFTACQSAPTPSFDLTLDPVSIALTQGEAKDVTVKLERLNGLTDPVLVTLKGLPADVTASPATLTMAGTKLSSDM